MQDLSHRPADAPLPDAVASGAEPFLIVGAIAGGKASEMVLWSAPQSKFMHFLRAAPTIGQAVFR
jgi:hypothetical protein